MFTIKIEYAGKMINLGRGINSLQALKKQISNRFHNIKQKNMIITCKGVTVTQWAIIQQFVQENATQIVRLNLNTKNSNEQNLQSSIISVQRANNQNLDVIEENKKIIKPNEERRKKSFKFQSNQQDQSNENHNIDFIETQEKVKLFQKEQQNYPCYKCEGKLLKNFCGACDGVGYFNQNHPYIKFMEKIIEKKIIQKFSHLISSNNHPKISNKLQTQKQKNIKITSVVLDFTKRPTVPYQAMISQKGCIPQFLQLGNQLTCCFEVCNTGKTKWQDNIIVQQNLTKQFQQIPRLQPGQTVDIILGPYTAEKVGIFQKNFRLIHKNASSTIFGHRFGFRVEVKRMIEVKKLDSVLWNRINELKRVLKSDKSTEYFINKLRQIQLNQINAAFMDNEVLMEILKGFLQ